MKKDHYDKLIEKAINTRSYSSVIIDIDRILDTSDFKDRGKFKIVLSQTDYTIILQHQVQLFGKIDPSDPRLYGCEIKVSTKDNKPKVLYTDQYGDMWVLK